MDEADSATPSTKDKELPARDEAAALAAAGGDVELARELFSTLLEGLPQHVAELDAQVSARNWEDVAQVAHRMRGGTSYCGVPALEIALQRLERAARAADDAQISVRLQDVTDAADVLRRLAGLAP
jgi:HPt (histidine-containing phosphotransfer) domain-containing protein